MFYNKDKTQYFWDYISDDVIKTEMDQLRKLTRREGHEHLEKKIANMSKRRKAWPLSWTILYATLKFVICFESSHGKIQFKEEFYVGGWVYDPETQKLREANSRAQLTIDSLSEISSHDETTSSHNDAGSVTTEAYPPEGYLSYNTEYRRSLNSFSDDGITRPRMQMPDADTTFQQEETNLNDQSTHIRRKDD